MADTDAENDFGHMETVEVGGPGDVRSDGWPECAIGFGAVE